MKPELFRPGTCDSNVFHDVHVRDEYRLNELDLKDKVCLDIGGHIGSFAYACIQRGAKKVVSFEPDPDNFCLFRHHLAQEISDGRVDVYPCAVGDVDKWAEMREFSGHTSKDGEVNTGGGFLLGRGMEDAVLKEYQTGTRRKVLVLDYVLALDFVDTVDVLKSDSEGGEWEVLKGIHDAELPPVILGEYHCYGEFTPAYLHTLLSDYTVELKPHGDSGLGLFWAK